jgi:hypothetical protein
MTCCRSHQTWLLYLVGGRSRAGAYTEEIVTHSGRSLQLPTFKLLAASWGGDAVPMRDIAAIRLVRVFDGTMPQARRPYPG